MTTVDAPLRQAPDHLPINEVFGPTWQGEGPFAGQVCWFVRTGYCNLTCSWCDTPDTWDYARHDIKAANPPTLISDVHARLDAASAPADAMVVLSGGEPMMWTDRLKALFDTDHEWHVETNGTIVPPMWWDSWVTHTSVSVKVATDDPESRRIRPNAISDWRELSDEGMACFKFVARHHADLDAVEALCRRFRIDHRNVWIMPEGTDPATILDTMDHLAEAVLAREWNLTSRLHTLLWGSERGR